ncbi:cathepsin G-like isoform X2 [Haemorhous mexicanus]|uniref:cathepsin G-like isoform X2 n=1 Tax=Haemorhous mexicanus TaxID=30427 RepID=UPI0028BD7413|nr:cathepsin G-like isoform X2 [Haemorhous mexicanus]
MLLLLLLTNAFVLLPWAGAGRIIGGCVAKPHSRPYMAYLEIQTGSQTSRCGGFLIRPDTVLSAAHCVDKEGAVRVTVILGAHNISAQEQSQQKIPVGQWVIHPEYSSAGTKNDIVLLKVCLKQRAMINNNVQCISIAKENERVEEGAECSVSGWGQISVTGQRSDVLMEVELKVQNEQICEQVFHNYQCQSMICVGDAYSKKSPYKGDSGGPLVCNKKAHGIASYVHTYNLFPEVFTRISYFEPWIRKQLRRFALQDTPGSPFSE